MRKRQRMSRHRLSQLRLSRFRLSRSASLIVVALLGLVLAFSSPAAVDGRHALSVAGSGSASTSGLGSASGPGSASRFGSGPDTGGSGADSGSGSLDPTSEPSEQTLLVWTSGGLPSGLASAVAEIDGIAESTVVRGDRVDLTASWTADGERRDVLESGWAIPLDAFAVDPATYAPFIPDPEAEILASLGPGEAILGATSARLRQAGPGSVLHVSGVELTVIGVLDDALVGAAEVIVDKETGRGIGVERERFVLARQSDDASGVDGVNAVEAAIRRLVPQEIPIRVSPRGEGDVLRHGSGVLPQSQIKERFGEFSYRQTSRREFTPDRSWVRANIVTERVPIVGRITCHREFMPLVRGALTELEEAGLAHLIRDYEGCWNARFSGARRSVSRHSWGIGIDFNAASNPYGAEPNQDPRLVEIMERWGMGWGGRWLVPDAMHFEYIGE